MQTVVKNTFIHTLDLGEEAEKHSLRKSASESDVSQTTLSSDQDGARFWLPGSRSSQSNSASSSTPAPAQNRAEASSQSVASSAAPAQADADDDFVQLLHRELGISVKELTELDRKGVLRQIPRNDKGEMSSVGSINHSAGECNPCLFWYRNSCSKGISCTYCHFWHAGQRNKRIRPSKKTRRRFRDGASRRSGEHSGSGSDEGDDGDHDGQGQAGQGRGRGAATYAQAPAPDAFVGPPASSGDDLQLPLSAAFNWLGGLAWTPARAPARPAPARPPQQAFRGPYKQSL